MTAIGVTAAEPEVRPARHLRAVLLLPFMNTVVIPGALLALFADANVASPGSLAGALRNGLALALLLAGLTLVVRTIALFVRLGRGTLAPWDPTRVLITEGLYRFSRNPMKAGLFLVLIGETVLTGSLAIAVWALAFITVNAIYIRVHEEPGLSKRFGESYAAYCRVVPRWLPWSFRRPA